MKRPGWFLLAAWVLGSSPALFASDFLRRGIPIPISACAKLTSSGFYVVRNDLTTTKGDCIVIAASNIVLSLDGHNIAGGGTGAGIHVEKKTARGGAVTGTFIGGATSPSLNFPLLSGFFAGLLDEADGTTVERLDTQGNQDGLLLKGSNSIITVIAAASNSGAGIHLVGAKDVMLRQFFSEVNTGDGVLLEDTTGSSLADYDSSGNGLSGTHIKKDSSHNLLFGFSATNNKNFGVLVEDDAEHNLFANIFATTNGNLDLKDENIGCEDNLWFANFFLAAAPSNCINNPNSIPLTTCGKIIKSGFYTVQNDLTSAGGDCIVIAASNVVLNGNLRNISGGGTGAGIEVEKTAAGGAPVTGTFIEGASVAHFAIGLLDEADATFGNALVLAHNGEGVLLKGTNSNFSSFEAPLNSIGVHLHGGHNLKVNNFGADFNVKFGIMVEASGGNILDVYTADSNGITGLYLGPRSSHNLAFDCDSSGNGQFGVEIEEGAGHNLVTDCNALFNVLTDVKDENPGCGSDLLFSNKFITADPGSCIH